MISLPRVALLSTVIGLSALTAACSTGKPRPASIKSEYVERDTSGRTIYLSAAKDEQREVDARSYVLGQRAIASVGEPIVEVRSYTVGDRAVRATVLQDVRQSCGSGPGAATEGNLVGRMVADHLAGRLPGVIGGDRIWSFSFVEDVAAAHVAALERGAPGARYLLGGVDAPQMRLFTIVRQLTGHAQPRRIPDWLASPVACAYELMAAGLGRTPLLTTGTLEILLRDWPLGHARASEELGYSVTPLEDGVARVLRALGAGRAATS